MSRGAGQSALKVAAYQARENYIDERTGYAYNHRPKEHAGQAPARGIAAASAYIGREAGYDEGRRPALFVGLYAPERAPDWCRGRENIEPFWNRAELFERRRDAQIAERHIIALPHELTLQQNIWALQDFVRDAFTRQGRVVQVAIHAPEHGDGRNIHAHLLVSIRGVNERGFNATKEEAQDRFRHRREYVQGLRERWTETANRHLARHGHKARIDHRTLEAQGIDRAPTIHLGPGDSHRERHGERSIAGEINREIAARNAERAAEHETDLSTDTQAEPLAKRAPPAEPLHTAEIVDLDTWRRDPGFRREEQEVQHSVSIADAPPAPASPPERQSKGTRETAQAHEAARIPKPAPAKSVPSSRDGGREGHGERGLFGRVGDALRRAGEVALDWIAPRVEAPQEPPSPPIDREAERRQTLRQAQEERARADREHMLRMYQEINDALTREDSPLYQRFEAERDASRKEREAALETVDERLAGIAAEQRRFYERRFAEEKIINTVGPLRHDSMMALMIKQREDRAALREEAQHERREAREKHPVLSWEDWLRREADRGDKDAQRALKTRERRREQERSRDRDDDELEL